MSFVVDCSAFGSILLGDELHQILPGLQAALEEGKAVVPAHWAIEVASAVQTAIRRGRMPQGAELNAAATIASLSITVDDETNTKLWSESWRLAERHQLTIYDSIYLELAMRIGAPLATSDRALMRAAMMEQVALFGR